MSEKPGLTPLGCLVIGLFVAACIGGAVYFLLPEKFKGVVTAASSTGEVVSSPSGKTVEIGIAYGTEKKRWLEWAAKEFAKTKEGGRITVNLIPMGSLEGAQALLAGDERIQVWSPASSTYRDVFEQEWQVKYGGEPILREEPLALSPMVFVTWQERYDAFVQKFGELSFATISSGLDDKSGWLGIAQKPEWGLFKFGHTHPNESNSGLITLVLLAYNYHNKTSGLVLKDILDPAFQEWFGKIENAVAGLSNSTGNMMREMVLKGPSAYDVLFVYENVAIDYLKNAEGRWGRLRLVYPKRNMWNDNPYCIIDASWSSPEQRKAANVFLDFLLSEPIQREALKHGFRPGNPDVAIKTPDSPFVTYQTYGVQIDLGQTCEPPKAEVINNLLALWQRTRGSR